MARFARVTVHLRIREWRERRGLTQEQLAALTKIPQPTISRLEHQTTGAVDLVRLEVIARALGVRVAALFREE